MFLVPQDTVGSRRRDRGGVRNRPNARRKGSAGLILILAVLAAVLACVLAVLGLFECRRHPRFYLSSIGMAAATLACCGVLGLMFSLTILRGVATASARPQLRNLQVAREMAPKPAGPELLHFEALGFVFHAPGAPWKQVNAKAAGPGRVLAMERAGPIYFTIYAERLKPGTISAQDLFLQRLKAGFQRDAVAYKIISEPDAMYNGIAGRLLEVDVSVQGHPTYEQYWMFENNGIGYVLSTWGRDPLEEDVKTEASRLFSDIELTAVQN